MEVILDTPEKALSQKVFSSKAALGGVLLGGPIVFGYILAHNYRVFGQSQKANYAWLLALSIAVVAFFLPDYIPALQGSSSMFSILVALGCRSIVDYSQANDIKNHLASGGQLQPWWVTLLIGLMGLLLTIAAIILFFSVMDPEGFKGLLKEIKDF